MTELDRRLDSLAKGSKPKPIPTGDQWPTHKARARRRRRRTGRPRPTPVSQ